jgi:L-iditol 2-dehydrogenase
MMKAAVMHGVDDLRLEEVSHPEMRADDALIRVRICGLCGSEFNKWKGGRKTVFPLISGHEWCGEVVDTGSEVTGFQAGDRVIGESCIPCGDCAACRDGYAAPYCLHSECYGISGTGRPGALAEYIAVKEKALHRIPDDMSYEEGALAEPLSVAYNAIWGVGGGVAPHDRVVVFGAGPIGLMALLTTRAASALVMVVEPSAVRRQLAERLGADVVIDPMVENVTECIMDHTKKQGATLVLECSANDEAIASTLSVAGRGGRIVLVGMKDGPDIPLALIQTQFKKMRIIGAVGAPFFFPKVLAFMSRKVADLTGIITHRFPLADIVAAFELGSRRAESGKIMIDCTEAG